jgi:hypothetical protein
VDENREVQGTPIAETLPEAQRNLPVIRADLALKAAEGAVGAAVGYGVKKALDKKFGQREPTPEPEPPAAQQDTDVPTDGCARQEGELTKFATTVATLAA